MKALSRREFMRQSSALAAIVIAPSGLGGSEPVIAGKPPLYQA